MSTQESKTHVFLKPCGCLACAIVNTPRTFAALAKAQKYAVAHGETYQLMETQAVREMQWRCPQHKVERKKPTQEIINPDNSEKLPSKPTVEIPSDYLGHGKGQRNLK